MYASQQRHFDADEVRAKQGDDDQIWLHFEYGSMSLAFTPSEWDDLVEKVAVARMETEAKRSAEQATKARADAPASEVGSL